MNNKKLNAIRKDLAKSLVPKEPKKVREFTGIIKNLTNHVITEKNSGITYPTSGIVLRAQTNNEVSYILNGIRIKRGVIQIIGADIPEVVKGTWYLVSTMVLKKILMEYPERTDFISPGPVSFRDEEVKVGKKTKIIKVKDGCNGFFSDYEELDAYRIKSKKK